MHGHQHETVACILVLTVVLQPWGVCVEEGKEEMEGSVLVFLCCSVLLGDQAPCQPVLITSHLWIIEYGWMDGGACLL